MAAAIRTARAEIYIQGNGQYTVMGWSRENGEPEVLMSAPGTNMTLGNALTAAINALTPLAGAGERHAIVKLSTTVTA